MKKSLLIILMSVSMAFLFGNDLAGCDELPVQDFFEIFVVKLNESQKNLAYAHKKSAIARVGTETINGEISGTLFYTVKIKGFGASVIMRYTNFSVEEGWTFDGELHITSDINQNGAYAGTITVTGKFPATVCYDDIKMKSGFPASGDYLIQRGDKLEKVIYSKYMEICEAHGLIN